MQRRRRMLLGLVLGAALFLALAYPAMWGELYIRRELYRLFELVGIMDPNGPLGGQILRFNYQRHPEWSHAAAQFLGSAAAFGPGLIGAVLLLRRVSGARSQTLCGCCGRAIRGAAEPRCPSCGAPFDHHRGNARRESRPAWWLIRRLMLAVLVLAATITYIERAHSWAIGSWVLDLGESAGWEVARISGFVAMGPGGPFMGDDAGAALLNVAYRHAPWAAAAAAGFAAGMLTYSLCAGPLGRTRLFGYRGPTRCGGCGYALAGLREMRCPECGRGI